MSIRISQIPPPYFTGLDADAGFDSDGYNDDWTPYDSDEHIQYLINTNQTEPKETPTWKP